MRGAVRRFGQVLVAMVAAGAVSVSTGGAVAAAAAPPAPAVDAGAVQEPRLDRGPGFFPPQDRPTAGLAARQAAADAAARSQTGPRGAVKEEQVAARTATSRTVRDSVTGVLTTEVSSEMINYRDTKGQWRPIDNTLVPADGGWVNEANAFTATFPDELAAAPVTVADTANPARFVSLQLNPDSEPAAARTAAPAPTEAADEAVAAQAASTAAAELADERAPAEPVVDEAAIAYDDAAGTGADVAYEVLGSGVKETVTLADAAALGADGTVSFTLRVGEGLRPVLTDGVITVVDGKGATVFVVPAPFMDDAAGAHSDDVRVTLEPTGDGAFTVALVPDATWLGDPARVFPVVVDPTVNVPSPVTGCSIKSATPTTPACGATRMPVSWDTTGAQERALIRFDELFTVIPADALVERAQLGLWPETTTGATPTSVDVRELTTAFTTSATWNTRNGTTAWGTPGGDRAGLVSARKDLTANSTYQNLEVGEMVSRWVEGSSPHHGFVVEKTAATSGGARLRLGMTAGTYPKLTVEWTVRAGARKGNTAVVTEQLTDRTSVSVNPATGNAAVTTNEYAVAGVGLDLQLSHTSNSLSTSGLGPLGYGWTTSAGGTNGVRLDVSSYAVAYTDGTGAKYVFHKAVDGTYVRPMGLDADLATGAGGTWTLTDRASKVVQTFTAISTSNGNFGLSQVRDRNGNTITYTYDPSTSHPYTSNRILRSVTDTRGRILQVTNPGYFNTKTNDVAGNRNVWYTVTSNELTKFVDADDKAVDYTYDAEHRVTSVTTPEGHLTTLDYDTKGRVTKLTRVDNPTAGTGPTWEFTYTEFDRTTGAPATTTTVEDPNNHTTTYTSDGRGRVAKAVDARGKTRSATYSPNDDIATAIGATASTAGGGAFATSTNSYNPATFTLSSTRTPTGAGVQYTYGTGARLYDVVTATDAKGNPTTYTYNTNGETSSVTRGGTTTRYLYQGDTDPAYGGTVNCGPTSGSTITATKPGVLCEERDALYVAGASALATTAHRTGYRYDTQGQLLTLIPPGTTPAGVASAGRGLQTYTYDALSRVTSITDGNGKKTTYAFDKLDRNYYLKHADNTVESFYFGDGDGALRSVTEYTATGTQARYTEYNRDQLLRVREIESPEGDIDFDLDAAGRMTMYKDSGGAVYYRYNDANQLEAITEPGGDCTGQTYTSPGAASTKCILFKVDDDGRRTGIRYPGGATQTWALDDTGRTTRTVGTAAGTARLDLAYTYTDATIPANPANPTKDTGLIQSITDAVSTRKTSYTYDTLDRLTIANTTPTGGGATTDYEAFCYDPAGNRTKAYTAAGATCASGSPAQTATYDAANQMATATGTGLTGTGFTYDGNGNQTTAKSTLGRTVTYNDRDQAVSTTPTGGSAITSTYAGTGNADRLTAGGSSFQSTPLSPAPGRSTTGTTSTWTVRDNQGALIAIRQGPTATPATAISYYPFTDQVDSVRTVVNTNGTVAATYAYTAYGSLKATTGTLVQPYQYGGGHTDAATGLIKLGARYYDPAFGRFTQVDPSRQEANEYLYAAGSPCGSSDPTGLLTKSEKCARAFLLLAASTGITIAGPLVALAGLAAEVPTVGISTVAVLFGAAAYIVGIIGFTSSVKGLREDGCTDYLPYG